MPSDAKMLTAWDGLALAALSAATHADPHHRRDADTFYNFVGTRPWDGRRQVKWVWGGRVLPGAELEDNA